MPGAAIGLVTALALLGGLPLGASSGVGVLRFGARPQPRVQAPLFEVQPQAPSVETPIVRCTMRVLHGDTETDPRMVIPVPKGEGVPVFTMRWAPSVPCDPARAAAAEESDRHARPKK